MSRPAQLRPEGFDPVRTKEIEDSLRKNKRFHRTLFSRFAKAINSDQLLQPGDKIAV
jgi:hypothetical protein